MNEFSAHIVIDNGSSSIKAGFNGENAPRIVFPSVIGQFPNPNLIMTDDRERICYGRDALLNVGSVQLTSPIKKGIITDWDHMEKLWNYLFYNQLKVTPEAHNVFLTEHIFNSNDSREKSAQILFEKFNVFNIHLEPQPAMTLYSTSKTTGLIFESGDTNTQIVPIYEGYIITQGVSCIDISGNMVTKGINDVLKQKLRKYRVENTELISKQIKEKHSIVKLNEENVEEVNFVLPDGNQITVGKERVESSEILFNPSVIDKEIPSVQDAILKSIKATDINLRKDFYSNIILGGGNTMIKNFPERLQQELNKKVGDNVASNIRINAQNERKYSAWMGASLVCSFGSFQQMWISKNDYEEIGPNIMHKKYLF